MPGSRRRTGGRVSAHARGQTTSTGRMRQLTGNWEMLCILIETRRYGSVGDKGLKYITLFAKVMMMFRFFNFPANYKFDR